MADAETIESERSIVAYHEAGHAVMAIACGFPVTEIVIQESGGEGHVRYQTPRPLGGEAAQKAALVSAAGLAADMLLAMVSGLPRPNETFLGHFNDQKETREYIDLSGEPGTFQDYLTYAAYFLRQNWEFVKTIALALVDVGEVNPTSLLMQGFPKLPDGWRQVLHMMTTEQGREGL